MKRTAGFHNINLFIYLFKDMSPCPWTLMCKPIHVLSLARSMQHQAHAWGELTAHIGIEEAAKHFVGRGPFACAAAAGGRSSGRDSRSFLGHEVEKWKRALGWQPALRVGCRGGTQ